MVFNPEKINGVNPFIYGMIQYWEIQVGTTVTAMSSKVSRHKPGGMIPEQTTYLLKNQSS